MRSRSLRRALLWRLALALSAIGVVSAVAAYRTALAEANSAHDRTLLASARAIAERIDIANGRMIVDVPYVALDTFQIDTRGRIFYRVLDQHGRFVSGESDFPAMPSNVPRSQDYPALVHFYDERYRGIPLRVAGLWQPVTAGDESGVAMVQVGETLEMRDDMARRLLVATLWQQAATIGVSLVLLILTVSATLRPLKRVQDRIDGRSAGSLAPIPDDNLPVEIQPLLQTLNQYLARLRLLIDGQKRFIDEASHQLRTSLSLVRGQVDHRIRSGGGELVEVRSAIDKTIRLTNQLLALARTGDSDSHAAQQRDVRLIELHSLCRDLCAEWYLAARDKGQDLGFGESDATAWIWGDEGMLREMLSNVLDNAVRYTPVGGTVTVNVETGGESHLITVEDTGPGIEPACREYVFERFARLSDASIPGSGLGLAIVRQICEAHGGAISLMTGSRSGLLVCIRLPARKQPAND